MTASDAIIRVLAGVNGAGKSSIFGAIFRQRDLTFFNPDEAARRIQEKTGWTIEDANSEAWNMSSTSHVLPAAWRKGDMTFPKRRFARGGFAPGRTSSSFCRS